MNSYCFSAASKNFFSEVRITMFRGATKALLLVHNGTLKNHEVIARKLPKVAKRHGTVDSEVLAHLLFYLTEHGTKKVTKENLTHFARRVDGSYACVMVNSKFPDQVVAFRKERPLDIILVAPLNIVILTSEKKFFEAALKQYEFIRGLINPELPKLNTLDRIMGDKDFYFFDTTRARGQKL